MKIFIGVILILTALASCGRKAPTEFPNDMKRPVFTGVTDE